MLSIFILGIVTGFLVGILISVFSFKVAELNTEANKLPEWIKRHEVTMEMSADSIKVFGNTINKAISRGDLISGDTFSINKENLKSDCLTIKIK
jgi:hypothetical protein